MGGLENSNNAVFEENSKKKKQFLDRIPSRYVVTMFCSLGLMVVYGLRVNLSIAIVAMVNATASYGEGSNSTELHDCPVDDLQSNESENSLKSSLAQQGTFVWTETTQGNVLGAFYYGYMASHTIGGRIAELSSPKLLFAGGIFGSAVFTLLTPICAYWSVAAMVGVRTLNGIFQGVVYPAMFSLVARWIPKDERSTIIAVIMAGSSIGAIISMPFTSYLCEYGFDGGWPSSFYVIGAIGIFYCVVFVLFVYNNPQDNPRISAEELNCIAKGSSEDETTKKLPLSWRKMLTSAPLWVLVVSKFCNTYAFHVILTKLPTYLDHILHQSIQENGLVNAMMYLINAISMIISGSMADFILRKGYLGQTATRKLFETISQVGVGLCMMGIPLAGCNNTAVIALLITMMGVMGLVSGSSLPLPAVLSPEFSGTVFGITNTFAGATGFIAPLIVGAVLEMDNGSMKQWSYIYYSNAGICAFGALSFLLFGSGERQDWAEEKTPEPETGEETKKRY